MCTDVLECFERRWQAAYYFPSSGEKARRGRIGLCRPTKGPRSPCYFTIATSTCSIECRQVYLNYNAKVREDDYNVGEEGQTPIL